MYGVWQKITTQHLQNAPFLHARLMHIGILDIRNAMNALIEQGQFQENMLFNYIVGGQGRTATKQPPNGDRPSPIPGKAWLVVRKSALKKSRWSI